MRVCQIGAPPEALIPARTVRPAAARRPVKETGPGDEAAGTKRERSASFMSYVPARKGGVRMEALRRYSHRAMAMLLETDPDVTWWTSETQPSMVNFDGREREVVPHFVVQREGKRQAIRVSRTRTFSPTTIEFHRAVAAAFADQGVSFGIVREADVLADPRLPAARSILWHRPWKPSAEMAARTAALSANPPGTLGELHRILGGDEARWPFVVGLVAHGWVDVDRSADIFPGTTVLACKMGGLD